MPKGLKLHRRQNREDIRKEQEQKERAHVRAQVFSETSELVFGEIVQEFDRSFQKRLRACGNLFKPSRKEDRRDDKNDHYRP